MRELDCIIYDDNGTWHDTIQVTNGNSRGATGITLKLLPLDGEIFIPGDEYLSENVMYTEDEYGFVLGDKKDLQTEIEYLEKENKRLQEEIEALNILLLEGGE